LASNRSVSGIAQPEEVKQEEVLRDHGRVRLELPFPPARRMLEGKQPLGAALDGRVERVQLPDERSCGLP
jgi:hypothetical protein